MFSTSQAERDRYLKGRRCKDCGRYMEIEVLEDRKVYRCFTCGNCIEVEI